MTERADVVVIGSGAGGGNVASVLAAGGRHVLVLERGRDVRFEQVGRDPLRNHRLTRYPVISGSRFGDTVRVVRDRLGQDRLVERHQEEFQDNAVMVAGGTAVYGAQAWRFRREDFGMRTRYGRPPGSSLADWPITYEELEPYYRQVEEAMGVCGDSDALARDWADTRGYPMPPLGGERKTELLREGANSLGWPTSAVPLLINSVARGGRRACLRCGFCVGFACPVDAKATVVNTVLSKSASSLEVRAETLVTTLAIDRGRVIGVDCIDLASLRHYRVLADVVVCSAGAIETARLLLNSAHPDEPSGVGNTTGLVGRNLQGHVYAAAYGRFDEEVRDGRGPGVSIATLEFAHGTEGVVGGSVLVDDFVPLPFAFWDQYLPGGQRRWGSAMVNWIERNWSRTVRIAGPVQEIPLSSARVQVDPRLRDAWGSPVARLSGGLHPATLKTASAVRARARQWLIASGAVETWETPVADHLSGGQHQAGTARMGDDPRSSVVDRWGRVHSHPNLWIADGSVHVTNGSVNPVLTIMALARRTADRIIAAA